MPFGVAGLERRRETFDLRPVERGEAMTDLEGVGSSRTGSAEPDCSLHRAGERAVTPAAVSETQPSGDVDQIDMG